MRYAFAGDRAISCTILNFLIAKGCKPLALFVTNGENSSHSEELINLANLEEEYIFHGTSFKDPVNIKKLQKLELDYIFGIHFPYIIPARVLDIPTIGFLNLHPAYLPFNKGWHTPSWAILDKTPYGATLHFMAEALDEGDIVHQKEIDVSIKDTADTLYKKVLKLEEDVFFEAFDDLFNKKIKRIPQTDKGTAHNKKDLKAVQQINLDQEIPPLELIDRLRALSTNKDSEAAFIEFDGKKIGIRVQLFDL